MFLTTIFKKLGLNEQNMIYVFMLYIFVHICMVLPLGKGVNKTKGFEEYSATQKYFIGIYNVILVLCYMIVLIYIYNPYKRMNVNKLIQETF